MANKKNNSIKTKSKKTHTKTYSKNIKSNSSKSVIANIYTYNNKKPKRLGKTCIHFDTDKLTCKMTGMLCNNADGCNYYRTNLKELHNISNTENSDHDIEIVGIATIVLNDNRKCTNNNHCIIDLNAKIRIAQPNGEVNTFDIPAAYCKECNAYFMLKKDYKNAKTNGKILCPIIDMTHEGEKNNYWKNLSSSESRIHQLGYNVQRGSNYTKEQRQLILANIIENTNISKHEIESCIIRPMTQHKSQPNYSDAVLSWQQDLEFVRNYKKGDCPEVIIDKLIIGKRKL